MGKKKSKKSKKSAKASNSKRPPARKLAKRIDRFVDKHDVTLEELAMAAVGTLGEQLPGKKHKKAKKLNKQVAKDFERLVKRGRRLAPESLLDTVGEETEAAGTDTPPESDLAEPVISYQHQGGGWYVVEVASIEVERTQGEEEAARIAGELLARYAALETDDQRSDTTAIHHTGGGWYEVLVSGVPVARVRGKEAVMDRYGHLVPSDSGDADEESADD